MGGGFYLQKALAEGDLEGWALTELLHGTLDTSEGFAG